MQEMFEQHSAVMLLIDPDRRGRIVDANKAAETFYGYSREQLLSMATSDLNTLSYSEIQTLLQDILAKKQSRINLGHRLANGRIRDVEVHASPIVQGGKTLIFLIVLDVSEHNYQEKQIVQQRNFLNSLIENAPIAIYYKNASGKLIGCNHKYLQVYGLSHYEQVAGKSVHKLMDDKYADLLEKKDQEIFANPQYDQYFECKMKTHFMPEERDFVYYKTTYFDHNEELGGVIGAILDVTEQKRLEQRLRVLNAELERLVEQEVAARLDNERKYELLFNANYDSTLVYSITDDHKAGPFIEVNDSAVELTGYSREELLNMSVYDIYVGDALGQIDKRIEGMIHGQNVVSSEVTVKTKKGELRTCERVAKFLKFDDRSFAYVVIRDITEKRRLEKQKRKQEQMMIQQSKMASMGEMIGVVGHQWKQPLNVIYLLAQSMEDLEDDGEQTAGDVKRMSQKIINSVDFMLSTLDDFSNFFKPSRESREFDLRAAVNDVRKILAPQMEKFYVTVEIERGEPILIEGYPNEFKQVVLNILNNAKEAIVEKRKKNGHIHVSFEIKDTLTLMRIQDDGGGIPENLLPDGLFKDFVSTKGEEGTGIGLSMSRMIIEENMQGQLMASNTDIGAEFTIILPLSR